MRDGVSGSGAVCLSSRASDFAQRGIWASRADASRFSRRNNRAFGSHPLKLPYLHRNPVKRGSVTDPADWKWSSYPRLPPPNVAKNVSISSSLLSCDVRVGFHRRVPSPIRRRDRRQSPHPRDREPARSEWAKDLCILIALPELPELARTGRARLQSCRKRPTRMAALQAAEKLTAACTTVEERPFRAA